MPRRTPDDRFVSLATLDVETGKTYNLRIGRGGRRVGGRLDLPKADTWMIRKAEIVSKTTREQPSVPIGVEVFEDGRFQAGGPSARRLHAPPCYSRAAAGRCGWLGPLLGEFSDTFTVHDAPADSPADSAP